MKFPKPELLLIVFTLIFLVSGCNGLPKKEPQIEAPQGMVYVPGGESEAGEEIDAFFIDQTPVTVSEFDEFVKVTKFLTQAERFGDASVFDVETGTWSLVKGANYLHPFGKNGPEAQPDHPVTQVSWNDATAYALWAGKRLPDPQEWFLAARHGLNAEDIYSWGGGIGYRTGSSRPISGRAVSPPTTPLKMAFCTRPPLASLGSIS